MMDLCEILINIHFQFKGDKWEISHEEVWRLQARLNDSYCFSMATKLVIQTQKKIELVWCNFFWRVKKPPHNSSVYLASLMDQLVFYSSFSNDYVYNVFLWYLPHILCHFLFSTSACLALSLYILITVNFSNYIKFPTCAFPFQVAEELIIFSVATLPYLFSACRANYQSSEKPHNLLVLSWLKNIFLNLLRAV